jgi:Skp family chaperone for outer membrane proteins
VGGVSRTAFNMSCPRDMKRLLSSLMLVLLTAQAHAQNDLDSAGVFNVQSTFIYVYFRKYTS